MAAAIAGLAARLYASAVAFETLKYVDGRTDHSSD
jgi:hypothetical protein